MAYIPCNSGYSFQDNLYTANNMCVSGMVFMDDNSSLYSDNIVRHDGAWLNRHSSSEYAELALCVINKIIDKKRIKNKYKVLDALRTLTDDELSKIVDFYLKRNKSKSIYNFIDSLRIDSYISTVSETHPNG